MKTLKLVFIHWLKNNNFTKFLISYKFISNFPPLTTHTHTSKLYLKFMQKIILNNPKWQLTKLFCKNFLIFLCFVNYFYQQKHTTKLEIRSPKLTLFILPTEKKKFTLLKAPFVNKLSKKHYVLTRYKIIVSIHYFFKKSIKLKTYNQINMLLKVLVELFTYFESNICYNSKLNITFPLILI